MGVETYGAYGPQGIKLVKQIGKKIQEATGEKLSTFFLFQSISMAIQRSNAVCVIGMQNCFRATLKIIRDIWRIVFPHNFFKKA